MERALLIVSSEFPPPFASQDQRILVDNLRAAFAEHADAGMSLKLAGPAMIGLDSAERSRNDATRLSLIGSVFLLLILTVVWRSPALVLAGALPLAAGAVCGLAATVVFFGQVHGLTLAFGFTLLGVVLDYPVHLFGHASGRRLNQISPGYRRATAAGCNQHPDRLSGHLDLDQPGPGPTRRVFRSWPGRRRPDDPAAAVAQHLRSRPSAATGAHGGLPAMDSSDWRH